MMAKGGRAKKKSLLKTIEENPEMIQMSMKDFGKGLSEHYRKLLEKRKRKEKAVGGRVGFKEGDTVMKKEFSDIFAQLIKPIEFGGEGMSHEDAMQFINTKFPEEFDSEEVSSNLGVAASGIEKAFGRGFGNVEPVPMLKFAKGGDVEDVEMMDEEFVGDNELRMEEGVQIGPMAEDGETDVEVLMAMKVSPGLIDEYRNYVFELKELEMQHQIVPFREWFNTTYGAARMGVKKGGKIIKIMPEGVIYKGKAKDYPGIKQLIKDMKKKGTRNKKAEGGLMNLGGNEMDLRGGGFVPMGAKERADDVPARLSKNEFVMTADAVRAAGGGSVDKGADLMYDTMKKLEAQV